MVEAVDGGRATSVDLNFLGLFSQETDLVKVPAGATLFNKDDPADTMFVVKSGELQIVDGNHVYETVSPGDILGEMALVDHEPRSATVRAITDSELVALDERRFLRMVERTPFFAVRVMRVMSRRMRRTNERARS